MDGLDVRPQRPFLDHRAFAGLAAGIPLVILLTSRLGEKMPSAGHFAGSALATAVCTLLVGGLAHLAINVGARHLKLVGGAPWLSYLALVVIGLITVVGAMSVLLPLLVPLCPVIDGRKVALTMQAIAIAAVYIVVARVVALLRARAQQHADRARQNELRALYARVETLKAQLNPHFLFNALNSVASLIPGEPQLAEKTVERLAGVLQYSLVASQRESVSVGEELAAVRDYLDIEKARFGGRLRTVIDVSPELNELEIPPLVLQPLVENAVLHGLSEAASGQLEVSGRAEGGVMVLTVTDNGVGPGKSTRRGHRIGLGHLRERLALTYGNASSVEVREAKGGGFECELRIPQTRTPGSP